MARSALTVLQWETFAFWIQGIYFLFFFFSIFFLFKDKVSFWSWETVWSSHQLKTCHYKRGISQCSFQNLRLFISGSDSLRKNGCWRWEGGIIFRRQPALWELSRNSRVATTCVHRPQPSSLSHPPSRWHAMTSLIMKATWWTKSPLGCAPPLPFACPSGDYFHINQERQTHLPPVRTPGLVSNQHPATTSCEYFQKTLCYFL